MKRPLIAAAALLAATAAQAGDVGRQDRQYFRVYASDGYMNMREGPGTNHALVDRIPAGAIVSTTFCTEREDGINGADWCEVDWRRQAGWVSRAGLLPLR